MNTQSEQGEGEEPPQPKKAKVELPDSAADDQSKELLGLVCHHFEPPALPADWVAVPHVSGATVYLHKPTRVVTLSRPYHVSTSNTIKKHNVYVQSIPCLEQWLFGAEGERSQIAQHWHTCTQGKLGKLNKIGANQLKEYLSLRWDSTLLSSQQGGQNISAAEGVGGAIGGEGVATGGSKRKDGSEEVKRGDKKTQQQKRKHQSPLVPESLSRLVSVRIPGDYRKMVDHPDGKKPPAIWEVNMAQKNAIVLLYEFCQIYLHISPDFSFPQTKGPPYQCEVKVGGIRYGSGGGANKKIAKLSAAGQALELFLPGTFSNKLTPAGSSVTPNSEEGLQLLSQVPIEDPQAPTILSQTGFPTPWQTLRNTLQWNRGFLSDKLTFDLQPLPTESHTPSTEVPPGHQFECILQCGGGEGGEGEEGREVRVTCVGRKDGQAAVAQAMLKKLHPYLTNWGSLLKLYSHPPQADREVLQPLPPSSVTEGCGLLSGADQQLLHSLRHTMTVLAKQRCQEHSSEPVTAAGSTKTATTELHQIHVRLAHTDQDQT